MLKVSRKALPGVVLILAMFLGAWTAPRASQQQQGSSQDESSHPGLPSKADAKLFVLAEGSGPAKLSGVLAKNQDAQEKVQALLSYKMDFSKASNDSEFDKQFVEDSLTSNSLEIWTMVFALPRVKDANLRNLIQVMLVQHTQDQKTALQLASKFGIDTSVDFTKASVYPETPDWDLGKRTEDLRSDYMDPLVEGAKISFDDRAQSILEQEHTSDVQSELTAERTIVNPELKAFAKHSADVTELHLQLLDVVHAAMQQYDETPSTDMMSQYMSPRDYTVNGKSNGSVAK